MASRKDVGVPVTTENERWVISQNFFFLDNYTVLIFFCLAEYKLVRGCLVEF